MSNEAIALRAELIESLGKHADTATWMGVVLLVVGFLSLGAPLVAGLSIVLVMGVMILAGGTSQMFFAFRAGSIGRGLLMMVMGLATAVLGIYMVSHPGIALASLTLFLVAWFLVVGITEIVWSLQLRPIRGWGLTLASGAASLLLGLLIWRQFPVSGAWAVGVLAGIKLIFSGWWLIILSRGVRRSAAVQQA